MIASVCTPGIQSIEQLHEQYLEIMPRLQSYAQGYFGFIHCPHKRADKVQEALGLAWRWLLQLNEKGKDVSQFPASFVFMVVRAVRCGRRLVGMEKTKDAMSPRAQQMHSFKVERLPGATACPHEQLYGDVDGQEKHDAYEERLHQNMVTPVPEQVAFRLDWPRFLRTLTQRDRAMARFLSLGNTTKHTAQKFGLTPGRVTQLRQQWHREWEFFQNDDASTEKAFLG